MEEFTERQRQIFEAIAELSERMAEDQLYEIVAAEIAAGDMDSVAMLKANEEALGNKQLAGSVYPRHRVRRSPPSRPSGGIRAAYSGRATRDTEKKEGREHHLSRPPHCRRRPFQYPDDRYGRFVSGG